jgi:predicted nucleic acid-binding protein
VAALFFDTSALVKRYDELESGADRLRALCRRSGGHLLLISTITPVEMASALGRKARDGAITQSRRNRGWQLFRSHRRDQYRLVALDEEVLVQAQQLLFRHPLRAYDALQIAGALSAARWLAEVMPEFRFCTADRTQATAAERAGLIVELIA